MNNKDIDEWLLDNNIESNITIITEKGTSVFLADILEKHLKEQLIIYKSSIQLPSEETLTIGEFAFVHFCKLKDDQYLRKSDNKTFNLKSLTAEYHKLLNK